MTSLSALAALSSLDGRHAAKVAPLRPLLSEFGLMHRRVMQNTLKQLVWLALCIVPLSALLAPSQARIVPIACGCFVFTRTVHRRGCLRDGTLGRAVGAQLGFTLNILLLAAVAARLAGSPAV